MVRVKRRYLVCEMHLGDEHRTARLKEYDIYNSVVNAVVTAHGDYGMALLKQSLNVKYFNIGTRMVIIRVKRGCQTMLQASLVFVKKIASIPASLQTLHISGTIRSCQKFLINYHRRHLSDFLQHCKTDEEKSAVQKSIRECCATLEKNHFPFTSRANELIDDT